MLQFNRVRELISFVEKLHDSNKCLSDTFCAYLTLLGTAKYPLYFDHGFVHFPSSYRSQSDHVDDHQKCDQPQPLGLMSLVNFYLFLHKLA